MIHLREQKPSIINGIKKNLQGHGTHDSRADDPRPSGNIHKKFYARKQAESDHFESFL